MFTVCPKCMLTLAVTANDLRMGQGYVRCGRCANVFNALLTLSEEPEESGGSGAPTPADRASKSQIIAAMREPPAEAAPPTDMAQPTHSQVEAADGPSTHLPTEQSSDGSIENESNFADGTGTFETIVLEGDGITQTEEYVPESSVDSEIAALTQRLGVAAHEPLVSPAESDEESELADGPDAVPHDDGSAEEFEPADVLDVEGLEPLPASGRGATPRQRWAVLCGCAALALLLVLVLQAVHHWRDALAAAPPWNAALSRTYAALGMPLEPHWDLAAYDVRQQGAVTDPNDSQVIRVRLSLANRGTRAQPLPLLRLTLLDRYGKRVASSELTPEQYWPAGVPPRAFLGRDERVDSEVAVRDPSAASASFELDVCLRGAGVGLRCAGDAPSVPSLTGGAAR